MDFILRCNHLGCRSQLTDQAVVTTCSHIFCIPCSEKLPALTQPDANARSCPACHTQLSNPDDAVVTQLDPTEDYKTSVLSGLSPSVIMECAGRGLAFYSYQATQEIVYQEHVGRSMKDKYTTLSNQMDKVIQEANTEIMTLREKLQASHEEREDLTRKNQDLAEHYRQKLKHNQHMQKRIQEFKHRDIANGIELAAEQDADNALRMGDSIQHRTNGQPMQSRRSNGSNGSGGQRAVIRDWENQVHGGSRAGLQTARSAPVPPTPSHHRTQLPIPLYGNRGPAPHRPAMGGDTVRQGTPHRSALNHIDPNVYGGGVGSGAGYGLSAGVKVGRQSEGPISRSGMAMGMGLGMSRPGGMGYH